MDPAVRALTAVNLSGVLKFSISHKRHFCAISPLYPVTKEKKNTGGEIFNSFETFLLKESQASFSCNPKKKSKYKMK